MLFLKNLPEMETVDREGYSLWNEVGTSKKSPEQKPPVMGPLFSDNTQNNGRPEECGDVVETKMKQFMLWRAVFPQERPDPFIEMPRRIQGAEDFFVPAD